MGNILSKCKRIALLLVVFVLSFTLGYFISGRSSTEKQIHKEWRETNFSSDITEDNCIICKTRKMYSNEDNLGIFFLNNGTVHHIDINKYNESGKLVESKDTYNQMLVDSVKSGETGIIIETNRDRGYSNVDIDLGDNVKFDTDKVSNNCCETCLAQILNAYYREQPYDILVLNYKTGDLKLITPTSLSFMLDDFYISCKQSIKRGEDEVSEIDLLIFYCPERYNNK